MALEAFRKHLEMVLYEDEFPGPHPVKLSKPQFPSITFTHPMLVGN